MTDRTEEFRTKLANALKGLADRCENPDQRRGLRLATDTCLALTLSGTARVLGAEQVSTQDPRDALVAALLPLFLERKSAWHRVVGEEHAIPETITPHRAVPYRRAPRAGEGG